jgi:hypothetical protein
LRASLTKAGAVLALAVAAMTAGIFLLFVLDAVYWSPRSGENEMRLFQRSIGGLGMGAAATPSWSIMHYDPRLQSIDDSTLWPVPGMYPYSPSSAATVVVFKELPREDLSIIMEKQ